MTGYSTIHLGVANARLRALKRRGVAQAVPPLDAPAIRPTPMAAEEVARLTISVVTSDANGTVLDRRVTPRASSAHDPGQRRTSKPVAGTRSHERRWRDASVIFIERRRGDLYKYGSIALCAALWAQVWWMFRM